MIENATKETSHKYFSRNQNENFTVREIYIYTHTQNTWDIFLEQGYNQTL